MDSKESRSLQAAFSDAESKRSHLESSSWSSSNNPIFQENLSVAIATYDECHGIADQVALFSPNESLEDVGSGDLKYMLIDFHLAELILKITGGSREANLERGRAYHDKYLKLLDSYDILSKSDARLLEQYRESPNTFSTASTTNAQARRETKVARFKEEKELKRKLDHIQQNPSALENDEAALRNLNLTNISLCTHQTFQSLESIAQELQILALAPPDAQPGQPLADSRERNAIANSYSERLDQPVTSRFTQPGGPILSREGRPLQPFTLLDNRQRLQQGVFRPDHNLPTMTIDEYLDEERRRGGIIEGGGEKSGIRPEPDEDNIDKADEETMKARAWDEFKEENPRGSGNTMNRG